MAPYFASAFGVFLMRQTFRSIPRDYEEAAMLDGASIPVLIRQVLVPLARPGLVAFAIVSVTAHWNEFLWPLMAVSSPSQPGADRRPRLLRLGRRGGLGVGYRRRRHLSRRGAAAGAVSRLPTPVCLVLCLFRHQVEGAFHGTDHPTHRARRGARHSGCGGDGAAAAYAAEPDRDRPVLSGAGAGDAGQQDEES